MAPKPVLGNLKPTDFHQPPRTALWQNIPWLRGLAICLVVFNHSLLFARPPEGTLSVAGAADFALLFLGKVAAPICVPVFLFCSAYFMGRFVGTWSAAKATVRAFALRYLFWSLLMYLGSWLWSGEFNWGGFLFGLLIAGKAKPAYWFSIVLIQFYLLTPVLLRGIERRPGHVLGMAAVLEALAIGHTYAADFGHRVLPEMYFSLFLAPQFILGLFVSKCGDEIVRTIAPYRRLFGWGALLFFPIAVLEVIAIGYLARDGTPQSWAWQWGNRVGYDLLVVTALPWLMLTPTRDTLAKRWLAWVGLRSLAILYLLDFVIDCSVRPLWHGERWLGLSDRAPSEAPVWLSSPWLAIPITGVTLSCILVLVEGTERTLGKRVRSAVFG